MNLAWSVVTDCKREFNSLGRRVYSCVGGDIIWKVIYSNVFNLEIPNNCLHSTEIIGILFRSGYNLVLKKHHPISADRFYPSRVYPVVNSNQLLANLYQGETAE